MKFVPFHHYVHLEPVNMSILKKTGGGIFLPDTLSEKAKIFKVLAVGPGFFDSVAGKRIPMSIDVGDFVLADVSQVANLSYCGRDVIVCPETGIFGRMDLSLEDEADKQPPTPLFDHEAKPPAQRSKIVLG